MANGIFGKAVFIQIALVFLELIPNVLHITNAAIKLNEVKIIEIQ